MAVSTSVALVFVYLLIPIGCVAGAIYLMVLGKEGWGWLLIIALLLAGNFSYRTVGKGKGKKHEVDI